MVFSFSEVEREQADEMVGKKKEKKEKHSRS